MGRKLTQSEKSSESTTSQQNQFGFIKQPDNPMYKNAETLLSGYDGGAGAAREAYGRNVNDIQAADNNAWGAETPAYAQDAMKKSRMFRANSELGKNLSAAKQNEIGFKTSGYQALGDATQDKFVQTGSTGTEKGEGTAYTPLLGTLGSSFASGLGGAAGSTLGM